MKRRRVMLSISAGLLLAVSLSIGGVSAGGGSLVILNDGEVSNSLTSPIVWSGTAWPDPAPADFGGGFCGDMEFFVISDDGYDQRMAIEFPLDDLPPGATVTSATLSIADVGFVGAFQLRGYAGDGAIAGADMTVGGSHLTITPPSLVLETYDVTTLMTGAMISSGWAGFSFSTDFDRSVHGADGYAGWHRFRCTGDQVFPPSLAIEYDLAPAATELPDGAMAPPGPAQPVSVLGAGLLLLAALSTLAVVSARRSHYLG